MPIFLNDLDNDLVDALVKYEITKDGTRRVRVMNDLINAFQAIAPDGIFIRNHDEFDDLELLASHAADEWVDRFGSRADRRVVLIKMFPLAEEIIATIPRKPKTIDYTEVMADAGSITEEEIERFQLSIDSSGYPDHWTTDQRIFALQNRYNPQVFIRDPSYRVTAEDVAWINKIMEGYKETP